MRHILLALTLLSLDALAMLRVSNGGNIPLVNISGRVSPYTSAAINVKDSNAIAIVGYVTVSTPAAITFPLTDVNVTDDLITKANHGLITGLKGQFTTTDTLPDGLALTTDYFIIRVSANTFQVASSLANALAGTEINIIDQGVGDHTFTPTALAGGNIKIQGALEDVDAKYIDLTDANIGDASIAISANSKHFFVKVNPEFQFYRVVLDLTAGALDYVANVTLKSEASR
jgi:hypothetical protein